jgi:putative Holliday junction resolvase
MRVMGLDVGDNTIGIAVSDALLVTAQGRPTLRRSSWEADLDHLRRIVQESEVDRIVVGMPIHMSGRESRQSQKTSRFATKLSKALELPIIYWDERLTSFAAEQHLEEMGLKWKDRKKHVDKIAAMFILQNYLDSLKS